MNSTDCLKCEGYGLVTDAPLWSSDPAWGTCSACGGTGEIKTARYCAICGEPEGSPYATPCCTDEDNMMSDNAEEDE